MRADIFLYKAGLARSRSHAKTLIAGGVTVSGRAIGKPSDDIDEETPTAAVHIENPTKYVSRGGLKLEGAIAAFSPVIKNKVALDLGASTGGFTDCLLQNGAAKVYAVDVGHGQLDKSLLENPKVVSMEGVNARNLTRDMLGEPCDLAVSDLSFIFQTLVYESVTECVKEGGIFISLIKPQFEAGKGALNKNGIVTDRKLHVQCIQNIFEKAEAVSLFPEALTVSPIAGGDGNREYLALFRVGENLHREISVSDIVYDKKGGYQHEKA